MRPRSSICASSADRPAYTTGEPRWTVISRARLACAVAGMLASFGHAQPLPQPYVDRVLDSGPQSDTLAPDADARDTSGWPRGLRADLATSTQRGPFTSASRSLALTGFIDTPSYGAVSLAGTFVGSQTKTRGGINGPAAAQGTTWRVDQVGMPLQGGWTGNHSFGDLTTLMPSLARGLGHVFLPVSPISGFSGLWKLDKTAEVNYSEGQTGLFTGFDVNSFSPSAGRITSGGAQTQLPFSLGYGSRLDAAVQYLEARDIPQSKVTEGLRARSAWTGVSWQGQAPWAAAIGGSPADPTQLRMGGLRVQANWLHSTDNMAGPADGGWLDAGWRSQYFQHAAGLFRFDPGLRWGPSLAATDLKGLYWRAETASRQWDLSWNMEADRSVTGTVPASMFASLFGRYRIDSRNAVGATVAARKGDGASRSLQVNWDRTGAFGQTQFRTSVLESQRTRTTFYGLDQAWAVVAPATLAMSAGLQQTHGELTSGPIVSWGVLAGYSPTPRVFIDGNVRGARGNGTQSLNASLSATWQLNRDWSLAVRYYEARGRDPQVTQVVSALTAALQAPFADMPAARTMQFILRFEERAGAPVVPLGGIAGNGAGAVKGVVFMDVNDNGERDATEAGIANVTIVLDGRFVVRTDSQGRYEFPFVVSGQHRLELQADNVPLPWTPRDREAVTINVPVRGQAQHDFSLQRER